MNRALCWLLDLIYPPKCVICGRILRDGERDACKDCMLSLPICTFPVEGGEFLGNCAAPFRYEGDLRESILRFKFGGRQHYARFYAVYLAAAVRERLGTGFDLVTWVPISRRRRFERGYDQAEELARHTAKLLGLPCARTLKKIKNNRRQSGISDRDERKRNVRGVYRAHRPAHYRGKRILMIDDIITSGATLGECAFRLRLAGAASVDAAVAATAKGIKINK